MKRNLSEKYINNTIEYNGNNILLSTSNNNEPKYYSKTDIDISNDNINFLQDQYNNLQNQLKILTKRIKEYDNKYNRNKSRKKKSKKYGEFENDLYDKNPVKDPVQDENNYLKSYINQMDKDINIIKEEVNKLLLLKREKEKGKENINNNQMEKCINNNSIPENDNISNLIDLIKQYSKEINYLKTQNEDLMKNLNIMNNNLQNSIEKNEIEKAKIIQKEEKLKYENYISNFVKDINAELSNISQRMEKHLINDYIEYKEMPSEIEYSRKNDDLNLIKFDLIKDSLDKLRKKLNTILNKKDKEITQLTNIIKEKENKYNELRKKNIDLTKEKNQLLFMHENEKQKTFENISKPYSFNYCQNSEFNYLNNLYEIIQREINSILSDNNLKVYHENLIKVKEEGNFINDNYDENILQDKLNKSLFKIFEFIEELKYDYMQIKFEYKNNIKQKESDGFIKLNYSNDESFEVNEYEIEELRNKNELLKEKINLLNKGNEIKSLKDKEVIENYEKEKKNLKSNNESLSHKLQIANENYLILESQNNDLRQKIKKLENEDIILKQKINFLSKDYQKVLTENNSLKLAFNIKHS
jgi:hypothetical protein